LEIVIGARERSLFVQWDLVASGVDEQGYRRGETAGSSSRRPARSPPRSWIPQAEGLRASL